jgi:hypothetical protein
MVDVDGAEGVKLPADKFTMDGLLLAVRGVLGDGDIYKFALDDLQLALDEIMQALRAMVRAGGASTIEYLNSACAEEESISALVVRAVKRSVEADGGDMRGAWFAADTLAALVDAGKLPASNDEELKLALGKVREQAANNPGEARAGAATAAKHVEEVMWGAGA